MFSQLRTTHEYSPTLSPTRHMPMNTHTPPPQNYQSGESIPVGYNATAISGIVFDGNQAIGGGTGASFHCDSQDACSNITVKNTFVANSQDPWDCKYVSSFTTSNNTGEASLEACMKASMDPPTSSTPQPEHVSYEQRKQAAIRAWEERGQ